MATNLLKANYAVIGYDLNEEFIENLVPIGLKKANTLSDIAENVDVVITMLPNGNIVEEIYDNILDNLNQGTLMVDCSTIDVDKAKDIHKKCEIKIFYLDV